MSKVLYCVIGPSGSGKSTYVHYAIQHLHYGEIISTTTRLPRQGEHNGVDYHFVSKDEFESIPMIEVDKYANEYYGTAQKDLEYAFLNSDYAFMVITYEGAQVFKKVFKEMGLDIVVKTIFIHTPIDELEKRMQKRGDDPLLIKQRIENIYNRHEYDNMQYVDGVFYVDIHLSIDEVCQQFVKFISSRDFL